MTAAELRALAEMNAGTTHPLHLSTGDILAALDDAERVATERVLSEVGKYLAGRRVRRMEQIEDLEELADRQFARACVLEIGVALHWVMAREKALRESAKGYE